VSEVDLNRDNYVFDLTARNRLVTSLSQKHVSEHG